MFSWYRLYGDGFVERSNSLYYTEKEAWKAAYIFDNSQIILVDEERCIEKNVKTPYQMMSREMRAVYRAALLMGYKRAIDTQKNILKYCIKNHYENTNKFNQYIINRSRAENSCLSVGIEHDYCPIKLGYNGNACVSISKTKNNSSLWYSYLNEIRIYKSEIHYFVKNSPGMNNITIGIDIGDCDEFLSSILMILDDENKDQIIDIIKKLIAANKNDKVSY